MGTPRECGGEGVKLGNSGKMGEPDEKMENGDRGREWGSYVRRVAEGIVDGAGNGVTGGNGPNGSGNITWKGRREAS